VIPGGIGGTKEGKRTSFGSAGADLTAEMMKNFLKADQVEGILI
jgi:aspartokinase